MGEAIGEMLAAAVGVAVSPFPIVPAVVLLGTPRGRVTGLAYLAGWSAGIAVLGTIALLLANGAGAGEEGGGSAWVDWLRLALGVLLVGIAARQWRGRPRAGETPATPGWMGALEELTAPKAAAAAAALSANPKNLVLVAAGAAAVAQTGIPAGEQASAWIVFTVIASLGVATPVAIRLALGERSREPLARLRTWLERNNAVVVSVVLLLLGAKLIGDAISGFSAA
jgi:threonine/homoserine/homoserine lactone efflux protein